jgi:hypothetical protein
MEDLMSARRFSFLAALALAALAARADDKDLYLENTEKVELKDPNVRVTRPNRDWQFLNLEALNKKDPSKANDKLKARLTQGGASANFYVLAWPDEREDASSEKIGQEQLESTQSFFKDKGKVTQRGRSKQQKLDAWGFEVEGALAQGGDEFVVSKLIVYRPGDKHVFVLSLEVPKKNVEQVKKDKAKLFSGVQLQ